WYYERPTEHSDGQVLVVVGGEVVQNTPWPFPWRDTLNLAVQRETLLPGQWLGDTVLTDAVSLQSAYNQAWSSLLEHVKLAGNARLAVHEQDAEYLEELSDTPGEPLIWRESVPGYVSPPQLPQWVV